MREYLQSFSHASDSDSQRFSSSDIRSFVWRDTLLDMAFTISMTQTWSRPKLRAFAFMFQRTETYCSGAAGLLVVVVEAMICCSRVCT